MYANRHSRRNRHRRENRGLTFFAPSYIVNRRFAFIDNRQTNCLQGLVHGRQRISLGESSPMKKAVKCDQPVDCDCDPVVLPVDEQAELLAGFAWALAHPARVRIVRLLLTRTSCVCGEIVDELPLAQSTVSQHLKILKASGLVQGEVDGPKVCYCINPNLLQQFQKLVVSLQPDSSGTAQCNLK